MLPIHAQSFTYWVPLVLALAVCPTASRCQESAPAPPPTPMVAQPSAATTPVAQVLVPEGYFAVQLANALKLGQPQDDDAVAETLLSGVGIEPKNGWIADYPVTPAVIGEIEKSVAAAAEAAKLGMDKAQALNVMAEVKAKLGLDVMSDSAKPPAPVATPKHSEIYKYIDKTGVTHYSNDYDAIPAEYQSQATVVGKAINPPPSEGAVTPENSYPLNSDPDLINRHYDSDGPPVVTYYPPPTPYYYLYSWVPYSFWSSGLYFTGYFVLRDFHRHIVAGHHSWLVSNHGVAGLRRVDAATRTLTDNRLSSLQTFNSPRVKADASAIIGLSQHHFQPAHYAPARVAGFPPNRGFPSTLTPTGRSFHPPAIRQRYFTRFAYPVYHSHRYYQGRGFRPHFSGGGHFGGGYHGGGNRGFHGGGFGGHGGGGRR